MVECIYIFNNNNSRPSLLSSSSSLAPAGAAWAVAVGVVAVVVAVFSRLFVYSCSLVCLFELLLTLDPFPYSIFSALKTEEHTSNQQWMMTQ